MSKSTPPETDSPIGRLIQFAPFDRLSSEDQNSIAATLKEESVEAGSLICRQGEQLSGLHIIEAGFVEILTDDVVVSHREAGDILGERALMRDGKASLTARAEQETTFFLLPTDQYVDLINRVPEFARWFGRGSNENTEDHEDAYATGLTALHVSDLMVRDLITCGGDTSIQDVAKLMRDHVISSVLIMNDDSLAGIVTVHDMTNKVLAEGLTGEIPVSDVMTRNTLTIDMGAVGLDALMLMSEKKINHLPVTDRQNKIVGMVGKTDLVRQQVATASHMAAELVGARSSTEMAEITARLPNLLSNLVSGGAKPHAICRRMTDITDAITRRLLFLAEEKLGPPPVPYLWAACGSQGRREQTGVSDQDNCLILDDAFGSEHERYFEALATYVCDGLNEAGFVYCPGDMMATNKRWRQPRRVWQEYFAKWIAQPDTEAQMLASVMFDLRPIAGDVSLFDDLHETTLELAKKNTIFTHHMIGNSLKHTPPLSIFRGISVIGSGEHKNTIDLKHAGVVPIIDLGRVYALSGAIKAVNTRERLLVAGETGVISPSGARDLVDAYDLIAATRLRHQTNRIADGLAPDNFLEPGRLSDMDRKHLRDAFMVVKTMQSAVSPERLGMG